MRASVLFLRVFFASIGNSCVQPISENRLKEPKKRAITDTNEGLKLDRIAFPIGGLGTGMICLEGSGSFSHVSVRNTAEIFHEPLMFAAISILRKQRNQ
jgi:hypothetical protein